MTATGFVTEGYERLRGILDGLVQDERETGAALSIWKGGKEVVSLACGWRDEQRLDPWAPDTLVHTYSTSKPFASLAAMAMVARGELELDEPVGSWWPDYACRGKESTTLRHILTHRAGLPRFPSSADGIDLLDDVALCQALEESPPEFPPGTGLAEHALTYGHLIDGALRAATGRSLADTYNDVVRPALGIDAWFGVPDEHLSRVADVEHGLAGGAEQFIAEAAPTYKEILAIPAGTLDPQRLNSVAWRQSVFGAINLHASASGLAHFYSELLVPDGPTRSLLGPDLHKEYVSTQVCALDETVGVTVNWTLGPLRTDRFIGLGGLGGSAAYWSFTNQHAVAYVTRRLLDHSRVGAIAAELGDDINMAVECD